jgi:hypothetical protein
VRALFGPALRASALERTPFCLTAASEDESARRTHARRRAYFCTCHFKMLAYFACVASAQALIDGRKRRAQPPRRVLGLAGGACAALPRAAWRVCATPHSCAIRFCRASLASAFLSASLWMAATRACVVSSSAFTSLVACARTEVWRRASALSAFSVETRACRSAAHHCTHLLALLFRGVARARRVAVRSLLDLVLDALQCRQLLLGQRLERGDVAV